MKTPAYVQAHERKFVGYIRRSTDPVKQPLSHEMQEMGLADFVSRYGGELLARRFYEDESGKGNDRPQLIAALKYCRVTGATLLVAQIDRLARNLDVLQLLRDFGVEVMALDLPNFNRASLAGRLTQAEDDNAIRGQKVASAIEIKRRKEGDKFRWGFATEKQIKKGIRKDPTPEQRRRMKQNMRETKRASLERFAEGIQMIVADLLASGVPDDLGELCRGLEARGIKTAHGKANWRPRQLEKYLERNWPEVRAS